MNTAEIRDRLYEYIRVADDKKIKAIYTMLEHNIIQEMEWWKNNAFVTELKKDYKTWASGEQKASSMAEIRSEIAKRKKKGLGK